MSTEPNNNHNNESPSNEAVFTEADMARARKWFSHGKELAEKKNYDYAIESYISGLNFWPEAVEEGHKPCRAAALFRGPRKVSFTDGMKYKTSGKDIKKAMLNAEKLLSKDPGHIGYMEAIFKNAFKAGYWKTLIWIGALLAEAAEHEAKPNADRFKMMGELYEQFAERVEGSDPAMAITALEQAVRAMSRLQSLKPQDLDISTDLRDVAGKLTILKGKYGSAESFKESVQDSESQQDLRDKDRIVQSDQRLDQLIASARLRHEEDPTDRATINELANLLCKRENEKDENQAIEILVQGYEATGEYRFKMQGDDIRMGQFRRRARKLLAKGDREGAQNELREQLRFELKSYKERCKQYPTDMRLRYQYGLRLFKAGRFDDAIPVLQEARNDPKTRTQCNLYVARCFFEKEYYAQAIDTLAEAIRLHETADDELGKQLHYRIGLAYEADGRTEEALKTYGQLIQWDYNYRDGDVRKRLDALKAQR